LERRESVEQHQEHIDRRQSFEHGGAGILQVGAGQRRQRTQQEIQQAAMTTFTGPASAITSSWPGFSGIRDSRATPPIGDSVMSGVCTPYCRAANTWPNSCSTTQANSSTTKVTLSIAARVPPWT
jgi:hypothetical protein